MGFFYPGYWVAAFMVSVIVMGAIKISLTSGFKAIYKQA